MSVFHFHPHHPSFGTPRTPRTLERRAPLQRRVSGTASALQGAEARGRRVEVLVEEYSIVWLRQRPFVQGGERTRPPLAIVLATADVATTSAIFNPSPEGRRAGMRGVK